MSTGTTAELWIDGARFADGTERPVVLDAPIALAGLRVGWGRDTTVDQPGPSTCSFTVADKAGGESFLGKLATGKPVEVRATGVEYPAPTAPTFADPGFESDPVAYVASNATAAATDEQAHSGARSLRVLPVDGLRRWQILLPPAPFQPPHQGAGAWDGITQTAPGQAWDVGIWARVPQHAQLSIQPVLFSGPWQSAATPYGPAVDVDGIPGQWVFATVRIDVDRVGSWVGLRVSGYPTGPTWDQMTGTWDEQAGTWDQASAAYLDDVTVLAPAGGTPRTVLVFAGRITSVSASWDDAVGGPAVECVATDFTADLDNRDVGDEPWPVEPMGARFERILTLSGLPVTADIDASIYPIPVSWRDVDRQGAMGLLDDLGTSVDGVVWPATHQTAGAYLRVEDPANRAPLSELGMNDDGFVDVVPGGAAATELPACDVLRDPVEFRQDVQDIVTRAAVQWKEQGVDQDGQPKTTDRTETVIDAPLESVLGTRRVGVSTQLTQAAAAQDVANRLIARLAVGGWRASGVVIDDLLLEEAGKMLQLLDGTSRIGMPLRVTGMPEWSPVGSVLTLYVEGGSYHYSGRWMLDLNVSSATGQGSSATWDQMDPAWRWDDMDPGLSWSDVTGVAGPSGGS